MAIRLLGVGALFGLVLLLQSLSGAYECEFGSYPDESAHVVTGLMVYDFLVGGDWSDPMRFAENYYLHYPEVALGHWPPFFYVLQALWMLVFSFGRTPLLLLMAALGTALAVLIFQTARRSLGLPLACLATLTFITLPIVQKYTATVMTELVVTLLAFAAALAFGRYLEGRRPWRWATAFGLLAALAILTKGSGLLLGLLPPFSMLFARRFDCLRRPSFWLPPVLVALLCAPFYLFSLKMQRNGMQHESFEASFILKALPFYSAEVVTVAGAGVAALALVGLVRRIVLPVCRREAVGPTWAVVGGLLASVLAFHTFVPCGMERRHLIVLLPALVLFMADGLHCLWGQLARLPSLASRRLDAALVAAAAGLCVLGGFWLYQKGCGGCADIARALDGRSEWRDSVYMISSDATGEGMLIAEVALHEDRPSRYVLRASKLLCTARWNGARYQTRFDSTAAISQMLQKIPVGVLLLDSSMPNKERREHHAQLREMVRRFPETWRFVGYYPLKRYGEVHPHAVAAYVLNGHEHIRDRHIEADMKGMLNKTLRKVVYRPQSN
jgi:hypothetical protein